MVKQEAAGGNSHGHHISHVDVSAGGDALARHGPWIQWLNISWHARHSLVSLRTKGATSLIL